jgi:hypothetical protein
MRSWKHLFVFSVSLALLPLPVAGQDSVENWPSPPFWSPRAPVIEPDDGSLAPLGADVVPSPPLPFVAINPCRIADTRGLGFTGQAGPPALSVGTPRTFQIGGIVPGVSTQCGIPVSAQAVSGWLTGKSLPRQANLRALAKMLRMDPHALQYGDATGRNVREPDKAWKIAAADQLAIDAFLALPNAQRKAIRELIATLAKAQEAAA